jgi:alpha-beta hydrolase superfamily lysophospholipase
VLEKLVPGLSMGNELKSEDLTRDPEMVAKHKADTANFKTVTPGWFGASSAAQLEVLAGAKGLTLPLGMFVGAADPVADPAAAREFFEAAGVADKSYKEYPRALHEILNETNRAEVMADIRGWVEKHL